MPIGQRLVMMRATQQRFLTPVWSDQMQTDGQLVHHAARYRHARQPGEVRADRVDVVQIHRNGVIGFVPKPKSRCRRRRSCDDVYIGKCGFEIVGDQVADFLRFEIVRVVIAGRQHVGSGQDSAFDLVAKALAAAAAVHVEQVFGILGAVSETNAVESRQVR